MSEPNHESRYRNVARSVTEFRSRIYCRKRDDDVCTGKLD
jgi:hypothetical protein